MKQSQFPALISTLMLLVGLFSPAKPANAAPPAQAGNFDCAAVDEIPPAECEALVALYQSAHGDGWTNHEGWLVNTNPCRWSGVGCKDGHVSDFKFNDNKLSGSLPLELGQLAGLKALWLADNQLSGSIPPELGKLAALKSLWLANNRLSGPIPPELGNLSNLEVLDLEVNALDGPIPPELGNLTSLKRLALDHNRLSGTIPPGLSKPAELELLWLSANQLHGAIPPELGRLVGLRQLDLDHNRLDGPIPPELGGLAELETLWLSDNLLSGGIPPELGRLTRLDYLDLGNNQLSGPLPASLTDLKRLTNVNFGGNPKLCQPTDAAFQAWGRSITQFSILPPCSPAGLPQTGGATSAIAPAATLILVGLGLVVLGAGMRRVQEP
jgi:hypothetical protein